MSAMVCSQGELEMVLKHRVSLVFHSHLEVLLYISSFKSMALYILGFFSYIEKAIQPC